MKIHLALLTLPWASEEFASVNFTVKQPARAFHDCTVKYKITFLDAIWEASAESFGTVSKIISLCPLLPSVINTLAWFLFIEHFKCNFRANLNVSWLKWLSAWHRATCPRAFSSSWKTGDSLAHPSIWWRKRNTCVLQYVTQVNEQCNLSPLSH